MVPAKRLVIDTNIWVSALVFGGVPRDVFFSLIKAGDNLYVSEEIVTEIRRILYQKFPQVVQEFEDLLTALKFRLSYVRLGEATIQVCRDPDDNMVLETAVLAFADYLISGDKDLLSLEKFQRTAIVTPRDFLSIPHD